jgi:putative hydrolase of the HAD superfamily
MTDTDYEVVFFDIGGVILDLSSMRRGYSLFINRLSAEYDLDPDDAQETWLSALSAHFKGRSGTEYRTAMGGYRKATAALFEDPPAEAEWWPIFERATVGALRPEPEAPAVIAALEEADYQLGIVSDVDDAEMERLLAAFEVRERFETTTTSEAVGFTKPDPRMFETALAAADVAPEDALMIGDRYRHDVEGAADAGLDAVAYGADARGPAATYEIDHLTDLYGVLGVER